MRHASTCVLASILICFVFLGGCIQEGGQAEAAEATVREKPSEIRLADNDLSVRISPTEGRRVNGVLTVEFERVPRDAGYLVVRLSPQSLPQAADISNEPNVLTQKIEPGAGEASIDTTEVADGLYRLRVTAMPAGKIEGAQWIAVVQTEVNVEN